jgi:hypothetical protein
MSNTALENRDAEAGAVAVAPRVTLPQIKSLIAAERYFVDGTLTICVLTLKNGYKVTGESAAADEANFNEELGRKIAREKAIGEIWPLAGFLLRETLHSGGRPPVMRCKVTLSERSPYLRVGFPGAGRQLTRPLRDDEREYYRRTGREEPDGFTYADPTDGANYEWDGEGLQFHAVYASGEDGKQAVEENKIFGDATPSASFSMLVRNPHVLSHLEKGRSYYVDFIPAD